MSEIWITPGWMEMPVDSLSATDIAQAVWQRPVEGLFTAEEVMRLMAAAMAGKVTDADTTSIKFRDLADSKDRIHATVDSAGNRTSIIYDVQQ